MEERNLMEIEGLSQRGQTLSIVDLVKANTLDVDMAAYSLYAIVNGASFLTAARPGNAGKTTLMSCLMTFLPPGIKVVTITDQAMVAEAQKHIEKEGAENLCFLCHEIGAGPVYGYLWGESAGQYLHLTKSGGRIASCLHADTLSETHDILVSSELGVSEEDFSRIGLFLFINLERQTTGYRRRVATLHEAGDSGKHNLVYKWNVKPDTFDQKNGFLLPNRIAQQDGKSLKQTSADLKKCRSFIEDLVKSGEANFRWVRKQVVDFYSDM